MNLTSIDFKELRDSPKGEALEHLARELGQRIGMVVSYAGRGPDGGRDLFFTEILKGPLTKVDIKWLVACKDFAKSGESVKEKHIGSITDKVTQHGADGYFLITTSVVSAALKEKVDKLDIQNGGNIRTKCWDSADLSVRLIEPSNRDLLELYLPRSYNKIKQMETTDQVFSSLKDNLTPSRYKEIVSILKPEERQRPLGTEVCASSTSDAAFVDSIVFYLFEKNDVKSAVISAAELPEDVIAKLLESIMEYNDPMALEYAKSIVEHSKDKDLVFNAFQFVTQHTELSAVEQIELASNLDEEGLYDLYAGDIINYVIDELMHNSCDYEIWSVIDGLSSQSVIEGIYVESLNFSAESKQRITFDGEISFNIQLNYGPEKDGVSSEMAFPGTFSGYIDPHGMYIEEATIDTSKFDS